MYEFSLNDFEFKLAVGLLVMNMVLERLHEKKNLETVVLNSPFLVRHAFYWGLVLGIVFLGSYGIDLNDKNFIYFQF